MDRLRQRVSAWGASRVGGGGFLNNVLLLTGGTALGQAVSLGCLPLLTRLYDPEQLGCWGVFAALVAFVATLSTLRYEAAIPLPRRDSQALAITVLAIAMVGVIALVAALMVAWLCAWLFGPSPPAAPAVLAGLAFLAVLAAGVQRTLSMWMVRGKDFRPLATAGVLQAVTQSSVQLLLGCLSGHTVGLFLGDALGKQLNAGALARHCWSHFRRILPAIHLRHVLRVAARYRRFPLVASWAAVLNTAGLHAPVLLLACCYDLEVVGWVALAQRVLGMPTTLLSGSLSKVCHGEFAALRRSDPERLPSLFMKTVRGQAIVAALVIVVVAAPAPFVFGAVLGEPWRLAGWCVLLLSPMYFGKLVALPLGSSLDVLERPDCHILREFARLALVGGAVGIAQLLDFAPLGAVAALSVASLIAYAIGILIAWAVVRRSARSAVESDLPLPLMNGLAKLGKTHG